ncbi:hypothetical protein DPMN_014919 [Dreissena polymorpha]|uniref:Uncharacterized protein n=1 Tax=Dreissena polymorpha TaxID=45954 RepID=A0A9D4NAK2_DREPO|nr:hypothetical protein DPMN_014919 [Dreissena polymorpha]
MANAHQNNWDEYLDGALFSQRTKRHSSTKFTPFFLLYCREAVFPSPLPPAFTGEECDTIVIKNRRFQYN